MEDAVQPFTATGGKCLGITGKFDLTLPDNGNSRFMENRFTAAEINFFKTAVDNIAEPGTAGEIKRGKHLQFRHRR